MSKLLEHHCTPESEERLKNHIKQAVAQVFERRRFGFQMEPIVDGPVGFFFEHLGDRYTFQVSVLHDLVFVDVVAYDSEHGFYHVSIWHKSFPVRRIAGLNKMAVQIANRVKIRVIKKIMCS